MPKPLPTQTQLNSFLKSLRDCLVTLIGTDLGKYQMLNTAGIVITEVDAIAIEPSPFKSNIRKIKPNSGIECIIKRTGKSTIQPMIGSNEYHVDYCIKLIQHNFNASTQLATSIIINSGLFYIVKAPVCTPFMEMSDGYINESTEIYIKTFMVHNNEYI